MKEILLDHIHRYPCMTLEDVYKLIHQAAMGSEHAIKDIVSARAWLLQEISTLGDGPTELLIDPISPDGRIVRIHLRSFVDRKLDPEALLQAFVLTAKEFAGSTERLWEYADVATEMAEEQRFPFSHKAFKSYLTSMQESGFPAVHHSKEFVNKYCPAYRVVSRELLANQI